MRPYVNYFDHLLFIIIKIYYLKTTIPLPSSRHHLSCDDHLSLEDKGEDYQNCSLLCCVRQLCIVICVHTYEQLLKLTVGYGRPMEKGRPLYFHAVVSIFYLSVFFFLAWSQRPHIGCLPYFDTWCALSANLECRYETCCARLAENTARKKSPKSRHLGTIPQISSQLRHVSTIGKKTC